MYGVRLFIVVLQELQELYIVSVIAITTLSFVPLQGCLSLFYNNYVVYDNIYWDYLVCIPSLGCCVGEVHAQLCPYRNVWPEVYSNYIVYQKFNMPIPRSLLQDSLI